MLLLNVGAGDSRFPDPWINCDDLYNHFPEGNPERGYLRSRLDQEPNYINMDISKEWWPGKHPSENADRFDGVCLAHVLEHFDVPGALHILREIHKCLKPGGVLRITVPDASYFRQVYPRDCRENWVELFENVNDVSENTTYLGVAMFFEQHKQCLSEDAVWCMLAHVGFRPELITRVEAGKSLSGNPAGQVMTIMDSRPKFSLAMEATR